MAALIRYWKLAALWALSLMLVGTFSGSADAQRAGARPGPAGDLITETPTVVTGNDIGFRFERTADGIAIGRLIVRVDGRWIETGIAASANSR